MELQRHRILIDPVLDEHHLACRVKQHRHEDEGGGIADLFEGKGTHGRSLPPEQQGSNGCRDRPQLKFVWSRDRCTQCLDSELLDYYWLKDLKKVKRLGYPLERVLMIDDSSEKLQRQYGNHLRVRPFVGGTDDTELRDVLPFLETLRASENLRAVEKRFWRRGGG
jgi:RNA polymerase II subunit A small phosphatase-like protein